MKGSFCHFSKIFLPNIEALRHASDSVIPVPAATCPKYSSQSRKQNHEERPHKSHPGSKLQSQMVANDTQD